MFSHLSKPFRITFSSLTPFRFSFHTLSISPNYAFPQEISNIANGKKLAQDLKTQLGDFIDTHSDRVGQRPGIAFLAINDRPDIKMYMAQNIKTWNSMGFNFFEYRFNSDLTNERPIIKKIQELNQRHDIHGIMIYLPLPQNLICHTAKVVNEISLNKDVEGITLENMSKISHGNTKEATIPCTAAACLHILKSYNVDLAGKHCVIINKSLNVGLPLFQLLLNHNATVTMCNPFESDIREMVSEADIVISAVGKPGCIKSEWVKDNAVIVDVGIFKQGKKTLGDIALEEEGNERFELVTPVPGGVGPLTVAMLAKNLVKAWAKTHNIPFKI